MSDPVLPEDIVSAAVTWLGGFPDVLAALGVFNIDQVLTPGLFQYRLWTPIESTSSTACVVESDGGWAAANMHNTLRFPRLLISVWADPIRDFSSNSIDPGEVIRRAMNAFWTLDAHLHRAQGGEQMWGTLRTVDCVRLTEPVIYAVPDGDGLVRVQSYYAVTQG